MSARPTAPTACLRNNLVFGERADDFWAVSVLGGAAPALDPLATLLAVADAAGLEASLLRVPRGWQLERCAIGMEAAADIRHVRPQRLAAYLDAQRHHLRQRNPRTAELYLSTRLPAGTTSQTAAAIEADLRRLLRASLDCEPAAEAHVRDLIQIALCRGLEPPEGAWSPAATAAGAAIHVDARSVRIATEHGYSHQAFLCVGALPIGTGEPLLATLDALDFEVEAALAMRPAAAASGADTALRIALSLCVAAPSGDELERRVALVEAALPEALLSRPADQFQLFHSHLPGRPAAPAACELELSAAQVAAVVPPLGQPVGTEAGAYLGYTLDGARRPVLFDLAAAVPAVVLAGMPGAGKTVCTEVMTFQAFLAGSRVVDVDPLGEHALCTLADVAPEARVVELGRDAADRGALDPLLLVPGELGERLARALLLALLPVDCPPAWRDAVGRAVSGAAARERGCDTALATLATGNAVARAAAAPIEAATGAIPALATVFSPPVRGEKGPVSEQVTSLRLPAAVAGDERLGPVLVRLLALRGLRLAARESRRHAVLVLDAAAGALLSDTELARYMTSAAAGGRVTALFATRRLASGTPVGLAPACLCFRVESELAATDALRAIGVARGARTWAQRVVSLPTGACLLRDRAGRTARVQVDIADPELLAAFVGAGR